jgi:hypothetical protein
VSIRGHDGQRDAETEMKRPLWSDSETVSTTFCDQGPLPMNQQLMKLI